MTCGLYFQSCLIDEWLWRGAVHRELCWWASWSKAGRSSRLITLLPDDNFLALGGISSVRHTECWVPSLLHFICLFFSLFFLPSPLSFLTVQNVWMGMSCSLKSWMWCLCFTLIFTILALHTIKTTSKTTCFILLSGKLKLQVENFPKVQPLWKCHRRSRGHSLMPQHPMTVHQ